MTDATVIHVQDRVLGQLIREESGKPVVAWGKYTTSVMTNHSWVEPIWSESQIDYRKAAQEQDSHWLRLVLEDGCDKYIRPIHLLIIRRVLESRGAMTAATIASEVAAA